MVHLRAWAGLHRTAPGVLEQLVDCSGGDVINEDTGFARKSDALLRVLKEQVHAPAQLPPPLKLLPP